MDQKDNSIAWAAGLFEGEGCISSQISNNKYYMARLSLVTTDEDVIRRFHEILDNIGGIRGPLMSGKSKKPYWEWRATGYERVSLILELILPWLGNRRSAKAKEVLDTYLEYKERNKKPPKKLCSILECTSEVYAKDLCRLHYVRTKLGKGRVDFDSPSIRPYRFKPS